MKLKIIDHGQIFHVKFVSKNENPAHVLECKPIEMFWYLLKAEVNKDDWGAQNLKATRKKDKDLYQKIRP